MIEGLVFDEPTHTYRLNGQKLPSVTRILGEFVRVTIGGFEAFVHTVTGAVIDAATMEIASDFGRAVHKAMEYTLTLGPDGFDYPDQIAGCVKQLWKWQEDFNPQIIAVEKRMAHPRYLYAGTSDIICQIGKKRAIVDVKTGIGALTAPQIAAYERMWRAETGDKHPIDWFKLYLPKDGGPYQFKKINDRNAWAFFQAKQVVYNYQKEI